MDNNRLQIQVLEEPTISTTIPLDPTTYHKLTMSVQKDNSQTKKAKMEQPQKQTSPQNRPAPRPHTQEESQCPSMQLSTTTPPQSSIAHLSLRSPNLSQAKTSIPITSSLFIDIPTTADLNKMYSSPYSRDSEQRPEQVHLPNTTFSHSNQSYSNMSPPFLNPILARTNNFTNTTPAHQGFHQDSDIPWYNKMPPMRQNQSIMPMQHNQQEEHLSFNPLEVALKYTRTPTTGIPINTPQEYYRELTDMRCQLILLNARMEMLDSLPHTIQHLEPSAIQHSQMLLVQEWRLLKSIQQSLSKLVGTLMVMKFPRCSKPR